MTSRGGASGARAFSLLEVVVATAIGLVLLSIIMSIWVQVQDLAYRGREAADLAREAAFAGRMIEQDLRHTGLGVPQGGHIQRRCTGASCVPIYGTIAPARFYASVLVASSTEVGILGDVSRPNAQYNTFGVLSTFRTGGINSVAWHTENNGLCMPTSCSTGTTSLFFPGLSGCSNNAEDRQCPWGMNRVQAGDRLQIVAGNGNWSHAAVGGHPFTMTGVTGTNGLLLSVPFDRTGIDTVWPNTDVDGAGPGGIPGAGWVTTLDRVFYKLDGDVLVRIQCWGDPDPDNAGWPPAAATAVPAAGSLQLTPVSRGAGSPPNVCTPPEIVARYVDSIRFRYFTALGAEVPAPAASAAAKASIHRIDFELALKRPMSRGRVIQRGAVGSVRLASVP